MDLNKSFSILPAKNLKYKFAIAFSLMSVIPLLVIGYLVSNYVMGNINNAAMVFWVFITVLITILIAFLGFSLIKKAVLMPILNMSRDAKNITAGDIKRIISITTGDEIGDLAESINFLTEKIRSNMDELKNYGEKTKEINLKIHQKILILSALLNISHMISQGVKLEELFREIVSKITELTDIQKAALVIKTEQGRFSFNFGVAMDKNILEGVLNEKYSLFLEKPISSLKPFFISGITKLSRESLELLSEFSVKSVLFVPVLLKGVLEGVLILGSETREAFEKEDIDTFTVFAKQISIALDNERLMKRNRELSILDELTGLFNERYITTRLEEEIKRAMIYQRPCAYIILNIDDFATLVKSYGEPSAGLILKKVAHELKRFVSPVDRLGKLKEDTFAFVLPEKNKPQGIALAKQILEEVKMRDIDLGAGRKTVRVTLSAGVSENPLDGATAQDLIARAEKALKKAKSEGKNCVRTS